MLREGKPWLIVAATHSLARTANEIHEFQRESDRGETPWLPALPPSPEWERFYLRPEQMMRQALDHLCPPQAMSTSESSPPEGINEQSVVEQPMEVPGLGTIFCWMRLGVKAIHRTDATELRKQLREFASTPEGRAYFQACWELGRELRKVKLDELFCFNEEMDDATFHSGRKQPAVQFFTLVWMPCVVVYGESAADLFQQARSGNWSAQDKLLRIDKRLLWCPSIAQLVDEASHHRSDGRFDDQTRALGGSPPSRRVSKYKCAVSAFVLRMSKLQAETYPRQCRRLTTSDMRNAFDAAARDRGLLVDEDLPTARCAYRKAVRREGKFANSKAWDIFCV